jgi:hypothetical protein
VEGEGHDDYHHDMIFWQSESCITENKKSGSRSHESKVLVGKPWDPSA